VDGAASARCSLVGDQLAASASKHRWAAIVVYGYVRDSVALRHIDIGVKALGCVPRKSIRKGVGERSGHLDIGGVTIRPGMYIYSDPDGIILSDSRLK
jgi:regulator of ribonuclease activity A